MTSELGMRQGPAVACRCPGCGLVTADGDGDAPIDHVASAVCYRLYGELLARSYSDPNYRPVHQMLVDAYAAQHAGGTSRGQVQTVALCLMTLCLFIENEIDPAQGPRLHKQMVRPGRPSTGSSRRPSSISSPSPTRSR